MDTQFLPPKLDKPKTPSFSFEPELASQKIGGAKGNLPRRKSKEQGLWFSRNFIQILKHDLRVRRTRTVWKSDLRDAILRERGARKGLPSEIEKDAQVNTPVIFSSCFFVIVTLRSKFLSVVVHFVIFSDGIQICFLGQETKYPKTTISTPYLVFF